MDLKEPNAAEINQYIDGIQEPDNRTFLLSVCQTYNDQNLARIFDLDQLVELFVISIQHLKKKTKSYTERFVFITNELNVRNFDQIQKFSFYWLLRRYLRQLDLSLIKFGARIYGDLISAELEKLEPIAIQYSKYDFGNFYSTLQNKMPVEQIRLLSEAQKEYKIFIGQNNIKDNNFESLCQKQIELIGSHTNQAFETQTLSIKEDVDHSDIQDTDAPIPKELRSNPIKLMVANYKNEHGNLNSEDLKNVEAGDIRFAAKLLSYSEHYVRKLCRENVLPHTKPHGTYKFKRVELLNWLDQKGTKHNQDMLLIGKKANKKSK